MTWRTLSTVFVVVLLVSSGTMVGVTGADEENGDDVEELEQEVTALEQQLEGMQSEMAQAERQQQGTLMRGSPDLELHVPDSTVNPGETQEVNLMISNGGDVSLGGSAARDVVTSARDVHVEADADGTPLTVESNEMPIGTITDAQPAEAPIAISVPDDVDSGTYTIDADISYSYTSQEAGDGTTYDQSRTWTTSFDVEVDDEARFSIVDVETDAQVGDTGTMDVELENIGDEVATDVTLAMESSSGGFVFGESAQDSARVDELEPGDTATVTYDVAAAEDTTARTYPLAGTVQFKTEDGLDRVDENLAAGVTPLAEQRFSITDVHGNLRVGEDGDLQGHITNEGPTTAENVVVQFTEESQNVIPIEQSIAVGSLDAGESAAFSLPVDISGEAEAIDREIDLAVQYRNDDLEQRLFEDTAAMVAVQEQRDQFILEPATTDIAAGEERLLDVDVTNNLDQTVTDVEASLFADDPFDSDNDEAFVEELEPGETVTMTFDLDAAGGATPSTYPISFDFRYDDERNNSQLSDTTRVAIDVTESEGGLPLMLIGMIVLTGAGAGAYVYQRR